MRRALLPALVAALLLGGCTGDESRPTSKAIYEDDVATSFVPSMAETTHMTEVASKVTSAKAFAIFAFNLAASYTEAARALRSIRPPTEVVGLHRDLVVATYRLARATQAAQAGVSTGFGHTPVRFLRAADRYRREVARLEPLYRAKGYVMRSSALGKL